MATIDIDDITIHYGRSGDGPPLLLVHGMCGDAEVWADQARRLSRHFTCVRFDRRGHSRSSRGDAAISAARHADDTAALIAALDLAPCLLVGSSSGAVIALDVARRYGPLLHGVVLSEPPLLSLDPEAGRALLGDLRPRLEVAMADGGPSAAVDAFFGLICPGLWSILDDDRKDRYRANAGIGFADLRAPSLDVTAAELGAVTTPALVLAGDRSHPTLRSIARRLAAALPDARFLQLSDCGHVTYAEQPAAFAHAVSTFAAELSRRGVPVPGAGRIS